MAVAIIAHLVLPRVVIALPAALSARTARIAVVHDWLVTWGGGENVLAEVLSLYPAADLFALVDFLPDDLRSRIGGRHARTTFLQHVPGARRHFRKLLPLFPRAIEALDLSAYDIVLSISHAVAKGVRVRAGQRHACYCLTPMRYAWDLRDAYLDTTGVRGVARMLANGVLDRLRHWDRAHSDRVSDYAAISRYIAARIEHSYGCCAQVIYPPVDTDYFHPGDAPPRRDVYFTASRWVPYKRIDAIVAAFRRLPGLRLVVAGDGPERARIRALAGANVSFVGELPRPALREAMRHARAFLFAAEEDFGIAPLEAQACGTPVIALDRGGTRETIAGSPGAARSGWFFAEQTAESIAQAVGDFEAAGAALSAEHCRRNAERFATARFRRDYAAFAGVPACPALPPGA